MDDLGVPLFQETTIWGHLRDRIPGKPSIWRPAHLGVWASTRHLSQQYPAKISILKHPNMMQRIWPGQDYREESRKGSRIWLAISLFVTSWNFMIGISIINGQNNLDFVSLIDWHSKLTGFCANPCWIKQFMKVIASLHHLHHFCLVVSTPWKILIIGSHLPL